MLDLSKITPIATSNRSPLIHNTGLHHGSVLKGDASTSETKLLVLFLRLYFFLLCSFYPSSFLFPKHTKLMNWGWGTFPFAQRCVCREISKAQQE